MPSTENIGQISFYARTAIGKYKAGLRKRILHLAEQQFGDCKSMTMGDLSALVADAMDEESAESDYVHATEINWGHIQNAPADHQNGEYVEIGDALNGLVG